MELVLGQQAGAPERSEPGGLKGQLENPQSHDRLLGKRQGCWEKGTAPHLVTPLVGCRAPAAGDADTQAPRLPHDGERQLQTEHTWAVWGLPVGLARREEGLALPSSRGAPRGRARPGRRPEAGGLAPTCRCCFRAPQIPRRPGTPTRPAAFPGPNATSVRPSASEGTQAPPEEGGSSTDGRAGQGQEAREPTAQDPEHKQRASTDLLLLNARGLYQQVIGRVERHPLSGRDQHAVSRAHHRRSRPP